MTTSPDLSTRLRESADDITFTGRPDPHDDKALLREAANEVERLRGQVAAYQETFHDLGQYLVAMHKPGQVDEQAVAILDGYHVGARKVAGGGAGEPGEHTLAAALRLLKLAHTRGAFGPGDHMLLTPPGPLGTLLLEMMGDPAIDMGVFPLDSDGHRRLEGEGGVEMAVRLLREAWQGGAFSSAVAPVDLSDAAAEVKAFNADENTLNARKLVTALAGEFAALASALDRDGLVPAADPQMLKIQEAIEGLDQLTAGMGPNDDGPVMARGEPLGATDTDLRVIAARARSVANAVRTQTETDAAMNADVAALLDYLASVADGAFFWYGAAVGLWRLLDRIDSTSTEDAVLSIAVRRMDYMTCDDGDFSATTESGEATHLAPVDDDGPDLLELGERARTTGRNLRLMMGDEPTVKHALLATAAAVLEDVADALAPVDEGSAA